jgi:protein TonB
MQTAMKYLITIVLITLLSLGVYAQSNKESTANTLTEKEKPRYPGGDSELKKYLSLNLHYPNPALEQKVEGEVLVGFIIDTEGAISDVKIIRGIGYGCDEEAVRVVKEMPQWRPACVKGKKIKVAYRLPVVFELSPSQEQSY